MHKLLAGRCILVVEDEMLIAMMIEDMLADLGCDRVVTAGSVNQGLAKIDAQLESLFARHDEKPSQDILTEIRNVLNRRKYIQNLVGQVSEL